MPAKPNAAEIEKTLEKKLTSEVQANIKQIIEQSLKNLWKISFAASANTLLTAR